MQKSETVAEILETEGITEASFEVHATFIESFEKYGRRYENQRVVKSISPTFDNANAAREYLAKMRRELGNDMPADARVMVWTSVV